MTQTSKTTLPAHTKTAQQGFTLMETLVAASILAVGVLAAATMISRSVIQDARAYHITHAALMAEEFFESLIPDQYSAPTFQSMQGSTTNKTINGVEYHMGCVLTDDSPMPKCKEMVCTISWNNKGIQSQVVNTYVYTRKN